MHQNNIIGIIGGMGPAASIRLQELIVERTNAKTDQEHLAVLCFSNPKIPDRTQSLHEDNGTGFVSEIVSSADALQTAGATIGIIACNTAHARFEKIQSGTRLPLLNLVELTNQAIVKQFGERAKIGLLATIGTYESQVFQKYSASEKASWILPRYPKKIMEAIYATKAGDYARGLSILIDELQNMKKENIDCIVLGCTELSLYRENISSVTMPFVDPLEVAADYLIKAYAQISTEKSPVY